MIFIQSDSDDPSTDEVIAWINYLSPDTEIVRLNDSCTIGRYIHQIDSSKETLSFSVGNLDINCASINARWYRRGALALRPLMLSFSSAAERPVSNAALGYINRTLASVNARTDALLGAARYSLGCFADNRISKMEMLAAARAAALPVPPTLFTNDLDTVYNFLRQHKKMITKADTENRFYSAAAHGIIHFSLDTFFIDEDRWEAFHNGIQSRIYSVPSLFQAYVEKKYELRVFYLCGHCYAMAIFSQDNEKTRIDYRNYDAERPNRIVPYRLDAETASKLKLMMNRLKLKSGSIDMIVSEEGTTYFLEVNPVGQYQWLSNGCNYFIDREIAKTLLNADRRE